MEAYGGRMHGKDAVVSIELVNSAIIGANLFDSITILLKLMLRLY